MLSKLLNESGASLMRDAVNLWLEHYWEENEQRLEVEAQSRNIPVERLFELLCQDGFDLNSPTPIADLERGTSVEQITTETMRRLIEGETIPSANVAIAASGLGIPTQQFIDFIKKAKGGISGDVDTPK